MKAVLEEDVEKPSLSRCRCWTPLLNHHFAANLNAAPTVMSFFVAPVRGGTFHACSILPSCSLLLRNQRQAHQAHHN